MRTVGQVDYFEISEKYGGYGSCTPEEVKSQLPDFNLGVLTGAHVENVPPRTNIAGDSHRRFGFVGQNRPGCLLYLLSQIRLCLAR